MNKLGSWPSQFVMARGCETIMNDLSGLVWFVKAVKWAFVHCSNERSWTKPERSTSARLCWNEHAVWSPSFRSLACCENRVHSWVSAVKRYLETSSPKVCVLQDEEWFFSSVSWDLYILLLYIYIYITHIYMMSSSHLFDMISSRSETLPGSSARLRQLHSFEETLIRLRSFRS